MTRTDKIKKLREVIQWNLDALKVSEALYIPKCVYVPKGKLERYVLFWESEFRQGEDIYISKASKEYESEDPENRLYKWTYNPDYTRYEKGSPSSTGEFPYMVPFKELIDVTVIDSSTMGEYPISDEAIKSLSDELEYISAKKFMSNSVNNVGVKNILHLPTSEISLKDLMCAIHLVPISENEFLNEHIKTLKQIK